MIVATNAYDYEIEAVFSNAVHTISEKVDSDVSGKFTPTGNN